MSGSTNSGCGGAPAAGPQAKTASEVVRIYTELAAYPAPQSSAQILPPSPFSDAVRTRVAYKVQDLASQTNCTLVKTAIVVPGTGDLVDSDPTPRDPTVLWDVHCNGGDHRAVVMKLKPQPGATADKFVVQIYRESRFVKSIDLTEKDKHGAVYDPPMGACQWSYNEGHLLYVAERKEPKKVSYFSAAGLEEKDSAKSPTAPNAAYSNNASSSASGDNGGAGKLVGRQFDHDENFGEQLSDKRHPVLCTLDVDSEVISVLEGAPDGVLPSEPCWAPDDTGVVFVGYKEFPYQLGLVYCQQRPCAVYYLDFQSGTCDVVGHDTRAVSSPRFSPDTKQLVWLQNAPSGPHAQCRRLICCDWSTKELRVIIDFVEQAGTSGFPGIFTDDLPTRCWSSNCRTVVLHSVNRSRQCLLAIDVETKLGELLPLPPEASSARVLDFHRDWLVIEASSPNVPQFIAAGFIDPAKPLTSEIRWTCLTECVRLGDIRWRVIQHTATLGHEKYGNQTFESVLVWPQQQPQEQQQPPAPLPLIAFPHGGPNTAFVTEFMRYVSGIVRCGYAVLLINYRGSIGFGKSSVVSLLGGIGQRDVSDCLQAVEEALASTSSASLRLDRDRVAVFGGSHGGFLGAHLIGQHPDVFRAAVLRNPVINLTTMLGGTDIPDWVWEQSGMEPFTHQRLADPKSLAELWAKSPLSHAGSVRAPTLIAIGGKDLRVPPQQGREFYRALKTRGVPARLLVYPDDCHPLAGVVAQSDAFVNIVLWFNRHLLGARA